jgi:preprotein translocase subunit SecA
MGLFSFLKSEKTTYIDRVWKTKLMAWRGMITDALTAITKNEVPIVFTYFENEQSEILTFLTEKKVPYYQLSAEFAGEAAQQEKVVFVCDASFIQSSTLMNLLKGWQTGGKVSFLFAGHYPLPSKEDLNIKKLNTSFPQCPIIFYSSLDEPAFKIFGTDKISNLMERMGMKEDEVIEHAMVGSAMKRAREKVESGVTSEIVAQSEEEWYAKNVKKS